MSSFFSSTYNGKQVGLTNEDIDDAKNAFNAFRAGAAFGFAKKLGATDDQAFTFARMVVDPHKALSEISENQAENALDAEAESDGQAADIKNFDDQATDINSFDDIVDSAEFVEKKKKSKLYEKDGDENDALKDFRNATDPATERDIKGKDFEGKTARDKKDGGVVTFRDKSRGSRDSAGYDGDPTVSKKIGTKTTKVRYGRKSRE